ncbi:hypothetical protein MRX96_051297 [Rhipicephalus microplus]
MEDGGFRASARERTSKMRDIEQKPGNPCLLAAELEGVRSAVSRGEVNKIPDLKNVQLKKDACCNLMNDSRNVPDSTGEPLRRAGVDAACGRDHAQGPHKSRSGSKCGTADMHLIMVALQTNINRQVADDNLSDLEPELNDIC